MPVPMRGQDPNNMTTIDVQFFVNHVNGYTFRLQPNQKFAGFPVGGSETLRITGGGWSVSRSEVCLFVIIRTMRLVYAVQSLTDALNICDGVCTFCVFLGVVAFG